VYNHHHELIEASGTIAKARVIALLLSRGPTDSRDLLQMKARAESLDSSLDALRGSFESVAQLAGSLGQNRVSDGPHRTTSSAAGRAPDDGTPEDPSSQPPTFDPLKHLPPIIDLPDLLRSEPARARADLLWGTWEPALRSWDEAGVRGVSELVDECREILREKRLAGQQLQARSRSQSIVTK
jgi:hypothetical protein